MSRHVTKRCSCGAEYDAIGWASLRFTGYQPAEGGLGTLYFLELRQCECGSTLAREKTLAAILTELRHQTEASEVQIEELDEGLTERIAALEGSRHG